MAYDVFLKNTPLKNGKPGKIWLWVCGPEYTKLNECDVCGKVSTPKKVQNRNDVYRWNSSGPKDYITPNKSMLCMGCWNKVKPLVKRTNETQQIQVLINQLKRTIHHERKQQNQNNGRASGLPLDHDVGR